MPQNFLFANLFEYALVGSGWFLLWRLVAGPHARSQQTSPTLARWNVSGHGFTVAALCVIGSWMLAQVLAGLLVQQYPTLQTDSTLMAIVGGTMAQLCLIGGAFTAILFLRKTEPQSSSNPPAGSLPSIFVAAIVTCVITISVVHPVQYVWEKLLVALHLPTGRQEMIEFFRQTKSPARLLGLTTMAVVLAPIGEEMVFRAGFYRYLRGRVPRIAALLLPSLVFALLHSAWVTVAPLMALGIVFSLAYERTGRISVTIVAHALFNLHTVIFLLLGLGE